MHIFNLDETLVHLLLLNNVSFWEKYMGQWKNLSCAIMPGVSGTDQHCFRGKGGHMQGVMVEMLIRL